MTTSTSPGTALAPRSAPTDRTAPTTPTTPSGPTGRRRPRRGHGLGRTLLLLGAVSLAGCAGADGATADLEPTLELSVVGTDDLGFVPDAYAVPSGEAIELILRSEPAVEHDLVVEGAGSVGSAFDQGEHDHEHDDAEEPPADDLHVAHALAGDDARSLFTISEAGIYEVYCSIPGHREAGMVGTLEVVD